MKLPLKVTGVGYFETLGVEQLDIISKRACGSRYAPSI